MYNPIVNATTGDGNIFLLLVGIFSIRAEITTIRRLNNFLLSVEL